MSFIFKGIARLAVEGSGQEESNTIMSLLGSLLAAIPAFIFWLFLFNMFSWAGADTTWSLLIIGSAVSSVIASILAAYLLVAGFIGGGGLLSRGAFIWLIGLSLLLAVLAISGGGILLIYRILIVDISLDLTEYLSRFADILAAYPGLQSIVLTGGVISAFAALFGYSFFYAQLWFRYQNPPMHEPDSDERLPTKESTSVHSNK